MRWGAGGAFGLVRYEPPKVPAAVISAGNAAAQGMLFSFHGGANALKLYTTPKLLILSYCH